MNTPERLSVALLGSALGTALGIGTVCALTRSQPTSFDAQFIDMMVPHHQGAVEMATIAQQRAEHPEIKELAQAIITDQQREIEQTRSRRALLPRRWIGVR